jgi:acetyl esterase/lipase
MIGITRRAAMLGCAAMAIAPARAAAPAPDLSVVDPDLRPFAENWVKQRAEGTVLSLATLAQARAAGELHMTPPLSDVSWTTRRIPVPAIGGEVTLYLINSQPGAARPAILHTHGGGFISGSPRNDLPRLQRMARELDVAIVSVAYDLAPEARYARSIEQTYAGLVWTHDHAAEIGVDRRRIAVMGDPQAAGMPPCSPCWPATGDRCRCVSSA